MRWFILAAMALTTPVVVSAAGCGSDAVSGGGPDGSGDSGAGCVGFCQDDEGGRPGCVGLECRQADCTGMTKTTVSGKVYDPAGKVPLYNVIVYVPNGDLAPLTSGLGPTCDRCDGAVTGKPIAITTTDAAGNFALENVPAGTEFPLVMQIGKWRRRVTIPSIAACQTAGADAALTRLPRNRAEGDIPRIALTTGSADPLECLLRKIGLEDGEFGAAGSDARVHLYEGGSTAPATATASFQAGGAFAAAPTLWNDAAALGRYDLVLLSCEGGEKETGKPIAARRALYDYAKVGGRVFTSHFHHYWFSNSPVPEVEAVAHWVNDYTCSPLGLPGAGGACPVEAEPPKETVVHATVNTAFPKGAAMRDWLENTGSLTGPGDTLPIAEMRHNISTVNATALSWMTVANPAADGKLAHEYITFNTPVGAADDQVCGRVVYSDLHVGAGDATGVPFPTGCTTSDLTPQQKALEFMLFDLSSCIQKDDKPATVPK